VVVAPHHVRDPEVDVVDDAGEVVRGGAVLAEQRDAVEPIAERPPRLDVPLPPLATAAFRRPALTGEQLRLL
jgi:hypothetical protein